MKRSGTHIVLNVIGEINCSVPFNAEYQQTNGKTLYKLVASRCWCTELCNFHEEREEADYHD